jgi:hypothetical protein
MLFIAQYKVNNNWRGELSVRPRRKEMFLGFHFLSAIAQEINHGLSSSSTPALSAPASGSVSFQIFVRRRDPYVPQHTKQEQRTEKPPSSARAEEETSRLWP